MQASIIRKSSAWDVAGIESFLRDARIPVRLASQSRTGYPLICSLWYEYADGALWLATRDDAHVAALLKSNPKCGFEVAADAQPYRGVRGQGRATLSPGDGPAVLQRLVDRYLGTRDSGFARWLLSRQDREVAVRIEPDWLTSWDYGKRMSK